jgi:hypothetical protein
MKYFHYLLFTVLFSIGISTSLVAQAPKSSYSVVKTNNVKDVSDYITALSKADMEGYRLKNKRTKLIFDTGVEIEMLSAVESKSKGNTTNPDNYREENQVNYQMPTFRLHPSGIIMALYNSDSTKKIMVK